MDYSGKERTGHWTQEEVEYLEAVVQEFRDGSLPLKDGATLRAYLAKELHCGVKRVSKKMEGTQYNGRHSFVQGSFTEEEKRARQARIEVLKGRFEQSVLRHERLKTARFDELEGTTGEESQQMQQQPAAARAELFTSGSGTSPSPNSNAVVGLFPQQVSAGGNSTARTSWLSDIVLEALMRTRSATGGAAPANNVAPANNMGAYGASFASMPNYGGGYSSSMSNNNGVASMSNGENLLTAMLSASMAASSRGMASNSMPPFQQPPTSNPDDETLKRTILSLILQGGQPDAKRMRPNNHY